MRGALPAKHELFPAATTVFLVDPPALPVPEVERPTVVGSALSPARESIPLDGPFAWTAGEGGRGLKLVLGQLRVPPRHSVLLLRYRSEREVRAGVRFRGAERAEPGATTRFAATEDAREVEIPLPTSRRRAFA